MDKEEAHMALAVMYSETARHSGRGKLLKDTDIHQIKYHLLTAYHI